MKSVLRNLAVAAAIAFATLLLLAPLSPWIEGTAFDLLYWLNSKGNERTRTERDKPVSVIAIDEETYTRAPFAGTPRALWTPHLAVVLNALVDSGAKVIGFDTVFATSAIGLVRDYDRDFLLALHRAAADDRVVLGELLARPDSLSPNAAYGFAVGHQRNIRPINVLRDRDGILRRIPLHFDVKQAAKPAFSLELASRFMGRPAGRSVDGEITLGRQPVPGTRDGNLILDPGTTTQPAPTYSFADIHDCAVAGSMEFLRTHFADRIVIIGSDLLAEDRMLMSNRFAIDEPRAVGVSARCTRDVVNRTTRPSFGRTIAGVYVHAVAVQQLLAGGGPTQLSKHGSWVAFLVTAFVFALGSITARPLATFGFVALAIGAPLLASLIAYWNSLVLPLGGLCLAGLLGTGGMTGYRRFVLDRDKRYLRRVFSLYLPNFQIDQLLAEGQTPRLGGERRTVSIMFADIERYTEMTESLNPEAAASLLNNCFDRLGAIVEECNGYIDKFVGDGFLAIFGAPMPDADHAASAVQAAIEMQDTLKSQPIETTLGDVRLRFGINTGSVLIGNIGSRRRFNYTVVGDSVNVAARLEELNRIYGTRILTSETSAKACKSRPFREIDLVTVVGRSQPTRIYEPIPPAQEDKGRRVNPELYADALALYRSGSFRKARQLFDQMTAYDPVSKVMSARCAVYEGTPPVGRWEGVYYPDHK